ncbi:hypothetical protein SPRG_01649 [Saprolegnia parasitica CBS 223.65]|uniref:Mediator complex subunit 15 KIX domain-containing protein n=1 Tax=Saprolegnia parasitica (strain CBS 223.65) TaxID=695850 RepID=A0A067CSV7_SAPPC|nr:hypothetical protein SPRG_01649 [Saprolegnia parasitica CBS 223.65]KDO33769.1 hypothetical protein SPRG_01649 [Saprolegnia parasitica CBS 223.65]|eukprot:XP_012195406.1 hypothetical protein SPRG_01649 [Saprolegnia parasitica CBS 223.65]
MAANANMPRPAYPGMPPAQAQGPNAMGPNAPDTNVRRSIMHALFMRYKQLHGSNADDATLQRMAANLEREIFQRAPMRDEYAQVAAAEIKRLEVSQQMYGTPPQGREMASGGATPVGPPQRPPAPYGAPSPGGMMDYRSSSSGSYVPPNTLSYQEFCARMQYQPIQKLIDIMWSQRTMIYDLQQELCHYKKQLQPPPSAQMYPPSYPPQQRPYHPSPNATTTTNNGESTPTTSYDRRPPPTPPQNATAYWAKVAELKDAHSNHLKKAYQILCMASQSTASMQSNKAESMKQNIHYAMVVLNETQETAAQPRDFSVITSVEAFIRESILPLIRKVQEVSQQKAGTPTHAGPAQGPPQQQQPLRGPTPPVQVKDRGQFTKQLLDEKKPSAKENQSSNMDDFDDFTGLDDLDDLDEKDDDTRSSSSSSFNAKKRPLSEL